MCVSCADPEDPYEGGVKGDSSGKMRFDPRRLCSSRLLWLSTMAHWHVFPLRGKATADGEAASVTDEEPALTSASRSDPAD
jgi:hypothetical protein